MTLTAPEEGRDHTPLFVSETKPWHGWVGDEQVLLPDLGRFFAVALGSAKAAFTGRLGEEFNVLLIIFLLLDQFIGLWSGVVRIHLSEESSVKHDTAINGYCDGLSLLHEEGLASAVTMVSSEHKDDFPAVFNEVCLHLLFIRIILERECVQCVNALFPQNFTVARLSP